MDLRHACWWWIFYEEEQEEEEEEEIGGVGEETEEGEEKDLEQEEMGQKENLGVLQSRKIPCWQNCHEIGIKPGIFYLLGFFIMSCEVKK
jgi:hypothetical protein